MEFNSSEGIKFNSPNFPKVSVKNTLDMDQPPLGTQFQSYELNSAVNHYLLDPFQYSITKFDYYLPNGKQTNNPQGGISSNAFERPPGLIYNGVDFEKILPSYTAVKKSVNDFPAQDYHRFLANDGYFNPNESTNNTDLWYYSAGNPTKGPSGAGVNVQEVKHIIFPEAQRGGTDTRNLVKYSWVNKNPTPDTTSWEAINYRTVNNNQNCEFFNYNNGYTTSTDSFKNNYRSINQAYSFDSDYCRNIGISSPTSGSMPFAKEIL